MHESKEESMSSTSLCPPNGILFLFDRKNPHVSIPQYIDGQLIAANTSCVSIGTHASVDGEVSVTLERTFDRAIEGMQRIFSGSIPCTSRKLAIVTAENTTILECEVRSAIPNIEVWVDHDSNPSKIMMLVN
jgi:hypothetical protein